MPKDNVCPTCRKPCTSKGGLTLHMNSMHLEMSPSQHEKLALKYMPKDEICPKCSGSGYHQCWSSSCPDKDKICKSCNGTGRIPAGSPSPLPTSPKTDAVTSAPVTGEDNAEGPSTNTVDGPQERGPLESCAELRREADGRYGFDGNMGRLCVCGHRLGIHAAMNDTSKRPCFNEDSDLEGATGEACGCQHFKPSRKKTAESPAHGPQDGGPSSNAEQQLIVSLGDFLDLIDTGMAVDEAMAELVAIIAQREAAAEYQGYRQALTKAYRAHKVSADNPTDEWIAWELRQLDQDDMSESEGDSR